jgi:hypothetical protein
MPFELEIRKNAPMMVAVTIVLSVVRDFKAGLITPFKFIVIVQYRNFTMS